MGTLYIVSTPIGNLQDITLRAIKTLFEVDVIACEDTRRTGILLDNLLSTYNDLTKNTNTPSRKPKLLSYYEQIEVRRIPEILLLLQQGQKIALISDAGTPAISDPGYKLIRECIRMDYNIEAIPGPSSVITALTLSGLPTGKFVFLGYPPHKTGHRIKLLENIKQSSNFLKTTYILFIPPHKLQKFLEEINSSIGDIDIILCREMTKTYQEIRREKISEAIINYKKSVPKGEFVILFNVHNTI